ncbi:MAG: hypothetical protein ABEJ78_03395 [Haloferacaceae archaeon]
MQAIPDSIDTDRTPPLTIPLGHFVVATLILLVGGAMGLAATRGPGSVNTVGMVHLLAAGWIAITIMGAMTQFVPVWSGRAIYSRRLAVAELWLVAVGQLLFTTGLTVADGRVIVAGTSLMIVGFWVFAWNMGNTLPPWGEQDVTERHFAYALASLLVGTVLGFMAALDFQFTYLASMGLDRIHLMLSHLTLTVFGFVTMTVMGALYQLGPMFTQSEETATDHFLVEIERWTFPVGVAVLAFARLIGNLPLATGGVGWILVGTGAFSLYFVRRLVYTRVDWGPMLTRYAVVALSFAAWTVLSAWPWLTKPISPLTKFGAPAAAHLLFVGVFGFVIVGTVYHVVPFIVWLDRYADRLGFEKIPSIDDLYDDRLAHLEFATLTGGYVLMVLHALFSLPAWMAAVGGTAMAVGLVAFGTNMGLVVWRHHREVVVDMARALTTGPTTR